jgi:transposase
MIQFTAHMRILVSTTPLDMRKGIDAISAEVKRFLQEDPMSGAIFLFISRSRKSLRILTYDGQGFWLCTKRLSAGKFPYWPESGKENEFVKSLQACEAQVLLHGGNPAQVRQLKSWKKIEPSGLRSAAS